MSKKAAAAKKLKGIGKLDKALGAIHKAFGKEAIMSFSGDDDRPSIETFSTGSLGLDAALGIGGLPRGRVVEIYGPESSGKTTLTLAAAAEVQKQGGVVAFIDAEHALDPGYAEALGVDLDSLLVSQPDSAEQALEIAEILVRSEEVDLVIVDSVAALVPKAEIDGEMGSAHVGLQARLMSQALRKLTSIAHRTNTSILFINQLRMKIGVTFGSPETTTGGNALKFYCSVRLDVRRIGTLKRGDEPFGNRTRVKVVKNKLAPPYQRAEFDILFGRGINRIGELVDFGVDFDVLDKSGAWISWGDTSLGQGREKAAQALAEDDEMRARLMTEVRRHLFPNSAAVEEPEPVAKGDKEAKEAKVAKAA